MQIEFIPQLSPSVKIRNVYVWATPPGSVSKYLWRAWGSGEDVHVEPYEVLKVTPKGCWILESYPYRRRFVLGGLDVLASAGKRWAYRDPTEALKGFVYRKRRHIAILQRQLQDAKMQLDVTTEYLKEPK